MVMKMLSGFADDGEPPGRCESGIRSDSYVVCGIWRMLGVVCRGRRRARDFHIRDKAVQGRDLPGVYASSALMNRSG